jgi:hypothetical protein
MPRCRPVVRTFIEDRFYEPELLVREEIQPKPDPNQGVHTRMIMEVLRANTRYYLRQFAHGQPTSTFEVRRLNPGSRHQFGLRNPSSKFVHLSDSEGVQVSLSGERPELNFVFEYTRVDCHGRRVVHLTHEFDMEPWSSVRVELVSDGGEESLTMTEYFVDE